MKRTQSGCASTTDSSFKILLFIVSGPTASPSGKERSRGSISEWLNCTIERKEEISYVGGDGSLLGSSRSVWLVKNVLNASAFDLFVVMYDIRIDKYGRN